MQNISNDEYWMRQALQCAAQSMNITTPNPRVGCIIVKNQQEVARGSTQQAGGPHAEASAIEQARCCGAALEGSTAYVTLEPCSHYGRTPPCALALVRERVARVVVAMPDPNPLVAGKGIAMLRQAGIHVDVGLCAQEASQLNPGFISRMCFGRPWVWSKIAASLDGRVALENGASQWITAPASRQDGQRLRARSCVVLSGIGTVQQDNPQLNVRDIETPRQPVRAILDRHFLIDETARLLDGGPVWIFTAYAEPRKAERLQRRNVTVIEVPQENGHLSLDAVFEHFSRAQFNEVHVEAGPRLNSALYQSGYLDELQLYLSPKLLGSGQSFINLPARQSIPQASRMEVVEQQFLNPDLRIQLRDRQRWRDLSAAIQYKKED